MPMVSMANTFYPGRCPGLWYVTLSGSENIESNSPVILFSRDEFEIYFRFTGRIFYVHSENMIVNDPAGIMPTYFSTDLPYFRGN